MALLLTHVTALYLLAGGAAQAPPLLPGDADRTVVEWDFQEGEALGWHPLHNANVRRS